MKNAHFFPIALVLTSALLTTHVSPQTKTPPSSASHSNVYRMEEGFVDAHGVLIYYKIIGHGAPLMLVHGGPGASHDYLLPYLLPLARTNQLIFIDERGSGRSEKLEDAKQYTVENMVEDVEAVRPGAPCLAVFETLRLPPRLRSGLRLTTTGYRYHGLMHPRSTAAFLLGFQSMYPLLDNREKWATPFPIVFNGALTECPRSSQVAPPFALFKGWWEPSYRASRVEERPFMPALGEAEEAA